MEGLLSPHLVTVGTTTCWCGLLVQPPLDLLVENCCSFPSTVLSARALIDFMPGPGCLVVSVLLLLAPWQERSPPPGSGDPLRMTPRKGACLWPVKWPQ